jgi:peptidyl-prolyl cis-trans isomerase C
MAEVDGVKLTRAQAERETAQRLRVLAQQASPQQLAEMRPRMIAYVAEQFIIRTLLLNEADRLKIEASDDDVKKELDDIAKRLPPGVKIEDVMKKSEVGEKEMKEEIATKIRIEKLFKKTGEPEVTDAEVDAFYARNGDKLNVPENVHARHILIACASTNTAAEKAAALKKAEGLRQMLLAGTNFAELAEQNSDCPSKKMGGDLGRFRRGQMVPAFDEAAFGQKTNEIGPVVETQYGYHIIEVLEHNEAAKLPKDKVREMVLSDKRRDEVKTLVDGLRKKAKITKSPEIPELPEPPAGGTAPAAPAGQEP